MAAGQIIWWIPALIVVLKGVWDVDAYRVFGAAFLLTNIIAGFALIPVAIWASKKIGPGWNLDAAASSLAELAAFEAEPIM